jgi:hypothetical protein
MPPTFRVAFGPNRNPAGFIKNRLAFPNPPGPFVSIVPKMVDALPPVTRPRMLDVGRLESLRKLAMLFVGTLKSPKLWNRFVLPPGLVPPVMLYVLPFGVTMVLSPDEVMGGGVWAEVRVVKSRRSDKPAIKR